METKEIRYSDFSSEDMRAYAPHLAEEGSRSVEGYAIVFNQRSRVLYDKSNRKYFEEVVERSAVSDEFLKAQDIKLLFNHDNNYLLARSTFGAGTLSFSIDEYGVRYKAELPNTTCGNDVLELIRRGDLSGCSFAFFYAPDGVKDERKEGRCLRTITKFASITDFSIVVDPAYLGTMVAARSFEVPEEVETREETVPEEPQVAEPAPAEEPKEEPRTYGGNEDLLYSRIVDSFNSLI